LSGTPCGLAAGREVEFDLTPCSFVNLRSCDDECTTPGLPFLLPPTLWGVAAECGMLVAFLGGNGGDAFLVL